MPRPTAAAPPPAVRSPMFTPAVMSLTLPIVWRTSGSVSFISSLAVSSNSSTAPCRKQQDRDIGPPAVAQERVEELGEVQDPQRRHHEAGRHQLQQLVQKAPSGTRRWVVLSELRWVPCLGFPSPVSGAFQRAFGRLSGPRGP